MDAYTIKPLITAIAINAGGRNGAIEFVARQHKKDVRGAVVTCHTSVGPREAGGFGIAVKMQVRIPTLPKDEALTLAEETHEKVCPYSHATRGNIDFSLEVEGA